MQTEEQMIKTNLASAKMNETEMKKQRNPKCDGAFIYPN